MFEILNEIINTPFKSFIASLSGAVTGTLPLAVQEITQTQLTPSVHLMQYIVWTVTILLAVTSIISWTQKQIDRYKQHHQKQHEEQDNQ